MTEATTVLEILPSGVPPPKSGAYLSPYVSEATDGLGSQPSGAPPAKSGQDSPLWIITASDKAGAVETTLSTCTGHIAGKTQARGQETKGWGGETGTWRPFAAPTSYVEVSAAESSWRECLTLYCLVIFTFWVVVLFQ